MSAAANLSSSVSPDDRATFRGLQGQTSIFGGLDEQQVEALLSVMDVHQFIAREEIFLRGKPASAIYIVLEGLVGLDFGDENNPLSKIEFGPGECFGETSVIGIQPHSATAIAIGSARLLILTSASLFKLYEADTKLFAMLVLNIAREASRRLHETDNLFLSYTEKNR